MKILFLSDDFPPQSFGGAGISTFELAIGMKKPGHEIFVITTCRKDEEAGEFEYQGLKVFRIVSNYPSKWRWYVSLYNRPAVAQVKEILKKVRPDVVHVNNVHFYLSYQSIKLAKQYSKAVVFTARDVMSFNFSKLQTDRYLKNFDYRTTWLDHLKQAKKRWNPFRNFFIRRYLGYADKLFAVSDALVQALSQNSIKNVSVMHTGIDADLWQVDEGQTKQYRERFGLIEKKVVLFGGRLSEAKGGSVVLEAMKEIIKVVPNAVLLVVSKIDGHTDYMKNEAEKFGIGSSIIFTGWIERSEIKYTYACADVVVVPSICFDSLPRIVLESMAASKPVVGTCYGGTPEAVIDGVTGYVVNPFDSKLMAEKILDILVDTQKSQSFGREGYNRIKKDFDLNKKVEGILVYYRELMNR